MQLLGNRHDGNASVLLRNEFSHLDRRYNAGILAAAGQGLLAKLAKALVREPKKPQNVSAASFQNRWVKLARIE
jgi:hypothetical protein